MRECAARSNPQLLQLAHNVSEGSIAGGLFDKADLPADQLDLFVFLPVVFNLFLLEVISPVGINRDDERAEFSDMAVPEGLRHTEIFPCALKLWDLQKPFHTSRFRAVG